MYVFTTVQFVIFGFHYIQCANINKSLIKSTSGFVKSLSKRYVDKPIINDVFSDTSFDRKENFPSKLSKHPDQHPEVWYDDNNNFFDSEDKAILSHLSQNQYSFTNKLKSNGYNQKVSNDIETKPNHEEHSSSYPYDENVLKSGQVDLSDNTKTRKNQYEYFSNSFEQEQSIPVSIMGSSKKNAVGDFSAERNKEFPEIDLMNRFDENEKNSIVYINQLKRRLSSFRGGQTIVYPNNSDFTITPLVLALALAELLACFICWTLLYNFYCCLKEQKRQKKLQEEATRRKCIEECKKRTSRVLVKYKSCPNNEVDDIIKNLV